MTPKHPDGFVSDEVPLTWRKGKVMALPDGMEFYWRGMRLRHRPGGYTDGTSFPCIAKVIPDADPYGWTFQCGVSHDASYHEALERWSSERVEIPGPAGPEEFDKGWVPFHLEQEQADEMIRDLLLVTADTTERQLQVEPIYLALKEFGAKAYREGHTLKS